MKSTKYYLIPIDTPPEVSASFVMCFDVDFDVDIISNQLGIIPSEAKRMSQCRFNEYENRQNPGYWEISTEKSRTWMAAERMGHLCTRIKSLCPKIEELLKTYEGTAIFRLQIDTQGEHAFPAIVLSPEDLKLISSLGAALDIIID